MPSPFPGMDPFLEKNPIFQELHTQILAAAQAQLQPKLRPKYVARLERHLSEGSVWGMEGVISLEGKEPDLTLASNANPLPEPGSTATLAAPTASLIEELDPDELQMRKQRRIVIYVQTRPRLAVTSIELLSPSNKDAGTTGQARYLEKRTSALHGGLHWVEIDLLRGGQRPEIPVTIDKPFDYLAYIAQATPTGWKHLAYAWSLPDLIPSLPIPLLGDEQVSLDLGACFREAFERTAADDEADYAGAIPPPALREEVRAWMESQLRQHGYRT